MADAQGDGFFGGFGGCFCIIIIFFFLFCLCGGGGII